MSSSAVEAHWKRPAGRAPSPAERRSPLLFGLCRRPAADSLTLKVMLLARMADLTMIFLVITALTFVLSAVAILVR